MSTNRREPPPSDPDAGIWRGRRIARRFVSPDGLVVLVGKNAADNDVLTLELGAPDDFWLHVAGASGSHVVVRNPEGLTRPPKTTLLFAASLAAGYSQASGGGRVAVHWTTCRPVSKRGSQPPGQVELRDWKVVSATPSKGPPPDEGAPS